jgi:type VI secretion system secreted protein VgrG
MSTLHSNEARFTLSVNGSSDTFQVTRWEGTEEISSLYQFKVEVQTEPGLSPRELLGKAAVLTVRDDVSRYIHGVVVAASEGRHGMRNQWMELVIAPRVWRLLYVVDCRIFQEKNLREIITAVLKERGIDGDAVRFELQATHPPHTYCVQYRESDWAFVSRLCEEEGVFYMFEHSESGHTLVFSDHPRAHPTIAGDAHVAFHDDDGMVEGSDYVSTLWSTARIGVGKVRLQDYNFVQPALDLGSDAVASGDAELEFYDYPGGHEDHGGGRRSARIRLEEQAWQHHLARGRSNCARLTPGHRFTLDDRASALRDELRQDYTITRVVHRGQQTAARADGVVPAPEYTNEFEVIPSSVAYRPVRVTPRPIVHGVQTAIVAGPGGEEIYTDAHGRVKVHFHWDRLGRRNEKSSCWVRVSQGWAGAGYGMMAIPRIGHEVIVSFLEGDPDRPLITGRVYHGSNTVPYDLPGAMTRTTLKSNSSPGGGGSNELRFEDAAGSEEVYLHAQKDTTIITEHNKNQRTGHNESLSIGNDRVKEVIHDQSEDIGNDKTIQVGHDHTEQIGNNATITIGAHHVETVRANRQEDITGSATLDVGGDSTTEIRGNLSLTVLQTKQESVLLTSNETVGLAKAVEVGAAYSVMVVGSSSVSAGGNLSEHTDANMSLDASGNTSVTADGNMSVQSGKNMALNSDGVMALAAKKDMSLNTDKKAAITAADQVTIHCGSATITVKKNGDVVVTGGKIKVEGSGNVVIKGSKVGIN